MTHRERFNRVMHFQEVDRIPNEEFGYWGETLERWRSEGMPEGADEELYFGLDIRRERRLMPVNNSGPIPSMGFRILSLEDLEKAKSYYNPRSPERYPANWNELVENYKHPDYLLLGGISKIAVSQGPDAIDKEIEKAAWLMERGGYIPFVDHRVPSDVTLANFKYYMLRKRELIGGDLLPPQCDLTNAREEALKPTKPFEYKPQSRGPSLE